MKRENVVVLKGSNWLRVHDVTQLGLWNRQKTKTKKVFFSWEKKSKTLIAEGYWNGDETVYYKM